MQRARYARRVDFHNIIGVIEDPSLIQRRIGRGDGIVHYASAKMDDVQSELVVDAEHTKVHMTGKAIYEVRRILLQHLQELDSSDRIAQNDDDPTEHSTEDWFRNPQDEDDRTAKQSDDDLVPVMLR